MKTWKSDQFTAEGEQFISRIGLDGVVVPKTIKCKTCGNDWDVEAESNSLGKPEYLNTRGPSFACPNLCGKSDLSLS